MFKILLSIVCVIAFLIASGFLIGGLAKKNKNMWISSLVVMVFSILIPSFLIVKGVKDTVTYVQSDQFAIDARATAKISSSTISGSVKGFEEGLNEEDFAAAANKGAKITGRITESAAGGFDATLGTATVTTTPQAEALGIEIGRSQLGKNKDVQIFTSFNQAFKGILKLSAYDSEGKKMDVVKVEVDEPAESDKSIIFKFENNSPGLSGKCVLHAYIPE